MAITDSFIMKTAYQGSRRKGAGGEEGAAVEENQVGPQEQGLRTGKQEGEKEQIVWRHWVVSIVQSGS